MILLQFSFYNGELDSPNENNEKECSKFKYFKFKKDNENVIFELNKIFATFEFARSVIKNDALFAKKYVF